MAEWTVEYQGLKWSSAELSAGDAAAVCVAAVTDSWDVLEPQASPGALIANVVALVHRRGGIDLDDAREMVARERLADLLGCLTMESPAPAAV